MPRLREAFPEYRRKMKSSGPQAVVTLYGKDHYLGPYGSKASKLFYDRLIAEWLAAGRQKPPSAETSLTVEGLVARYWKHTKGIYRRPDGTPMSTAGNMKPVLRAVKQLSGPTEAEKFAPIALKAVRLQIVERRLLGVGDEDLKLFIFWGPATTIAEQGIRPPRTPAA